MTQAPQVTTTDDAASEVPTPVLLVGAFSNGGGITLQPDAQPLDDALDGYLGNLTDAGYKAGLGEMAIVPTFGNVAAGRVAVVGLGSENAAGPKELRRAAAIATRQLSEHHEVATLLHKAVGDGADAHARRHRGPHDRHVPLHRSEERTPPVQDRAHRVGRSRG